MDKSFLLNFSKAIFLLFLHFFIFYEFAQAREDSLKAQLGILSNTSELAEPSDRAKSEETSGIGNDIYLEYTIANFSPKLDLIFSFRNTQNTNETELTNTNSQIHSFDDNTNLRTFLIGGEYYLSPKREPRNSIEISLLDYEYSFKSDNYEPQSRSDFRESVSNGGGNGFSVRINHTLSQKTDLILGYASSSYSFDKEAAAALLIPNQTNQENTDTRILEIGTSFYFNSYVATRRHELEVVYGALSSNRKENNFRNSFTGISEQSDEISGNRLTVEYNYVFNSRLDLAFSSSSLFTNTKRTIKEADTESEEKLSEEKFTGIGAAIFLGFEYYYW